MAESVRLKDGRYIDTEGVYDFEQKKTQKEINAYLVQADNIKSGYFALPSGLKMCWGELKFTENEKQITFPITFSAAPKVFTNLQGSQDSTRKIIVTSTAYNITTTGFLGTKRYYNTTDNGFGNATEVFQWFAIGY